MMRSLVVLVVLMTTAADGQFVCKRLSIDGIGTKCSAMKPAPTPKCWCPCGNTWLAKVSYSVTEYCKRLPLWQTWLPALAGVGASTVGGPAVGGIVSDAVSFLIAKHAMNQLLSNVAVFGVVVALAAWSRRGGSMSELFAHATTFIPAMARRGRDFIVYAAPSARRTRRRLSEEEMSDIIAEVIKVRRSRRGEVLREALLEESGCEVSLDAADNAAYSIGLKGKAESPEAFESNAMRIISDLVASSHRR